MSLATLRPRTQLALAVLLPLVCIGLGAALIWPHTSRLREANQQLRTTVTSIQQKKRSISQAELAARGRSLALAVALPGEQEPILFLRQLAALTNESGAVLAAVRSTSPPPMPAANAPTRDSGASTSGNPSGQQTPGTGTPAGVGQGQRPVIPASTVRELTNEVTVEGRFGDILALVVRLESFERILSVSQCRIRAASQSYPQLHAVFTVSRFVAVPEPPRPAAATQTASGQRSAATAAR
jgi:hypothetical protein